MYSNSDANILQSNRDVKLERDTFVESQTQLINVNCHEIDAESNSVINRKHNTRNGSRASIESNQSPLDNYDEHFKIDKQQLPASDRNFLRVNSVSSTVSSSASESSKSKFSERARRKSWYNIIYPTYKARSESFKRLFNDVPDNERLIVDYSCALQREILAHGRMFVSQHYLCFHANIFGWETFLSLKWRDVTAITKEKTALVIPNAILVSTKTEKYFITSFAARDKTYLQLFRIWQDALMNKSMVAQEFWQSIHNVYGDQLGLTSDDEDYIDPTTDQVIAPNTKTTTENTTKLIITEKNSKRDNLNELATDYSKCNESDNDKFVLSRDSVFIDSVDSSAAYSRNSTVAANATVLKAKMRITRSKIVGITDENVPTDVSDSTDDENSVPFVCTAECTSMHEGRQIVHTILPINVDSLMTLLFSKSKFFTEFHSMRKSTNMVLRDWVSGNDGLKTRTINFTVAVTQAVGPKTCNVTETQKMRDCSVPGQLYSIDITSINAGIPYADSFQVIFHYCLVRTVDDHTMLSVYAQIKYIKSVWGVVKGFIEKNIWCGLEDFYKALLNALQNEYCLPPAKSKSRRNKRALTQKAIAEDVPIKAKSAPNVTTNVSLPSDGALPLVATKLTSQIIKSSSSLPVAKSPHTNLLSNVFMKHFSIGIVVVIIVLTLLNIYLIAKLYVLETNGNINSLTTSSSAAGAVQHNEIPITSDKYSRENWLNMLSEQNAIPDAEMSKWQEYIKATIELLQKIENIYTGLSLEFNDSVAAGIKDEMK